MEIFNNLDLSKVKSVSEYNNYIQSKKAAQEVETVFINMMLKEMFKNASKNPFTMEESKGVNNTQKEMMYDLLSQTLSQQWAQNNPILSDQILEQLNSKNFLED